MLIHPAPKIHDIMEEILELRFIDYGVYILCTLEFVPSTASYGRSSAPADGGPVYPDGSDFEHDRGSAITSKPLQVIESTVYC